MDAPGWVLLSWISAGVFQTWIMLFWRLELFYRKISKYFGSSGFLIFKTGFILFGTLRLLPVIPVSILSAGTGSCVVCKTDSKYFSLKYPETKI